MKADETIGRAQLIKSFMEKCGMTYVEACSAYECMISTVETAVICGSKVSFGRIGVLLPVWCGPRDIKMGFKRTAGNVVEKVQRQFFLDGRIRYKFKLHKKFIKTRDLRWFVEPVE